MWYLVSSTSPDVKYVILCGREYTVGRKDCDVCLSTDPTVSRKHAILQLTHLDTNLAYPQKSALVTLQDLSKFGTFLNKKKISGQVLIKDGDEVTFGSPKSIFLLVNEPFIATTSCLDVTSKKASKVIVRSLGGHIVSEWTKACGLLVMSSISVTIKVICALSTQKNIVLPEYLVKLEQHLKGNGDAPKPEDFLPEVSETQINSSMVSFKPNPKRASVFNGMKFIFLNPKQFKKMNLAVELAGGMPVLMEEGSDDNDDRVLVMPGTVVMNCSPLDQENLTTAGQEWVSHVYKYLKRKKKFIIQDAEIGYAVLYCSTQTNCNPDIFKDISCQKVPSQSLTEATMTQQSIPNHFVANTELSPRPKYSQKLETGPDKIDETIVNTKVVEVKNELISQNVKSPKRKRETAHNNQIDEELGLKRIKHEDATPVQKSKLGSTSKTEAEDDGTKKLKGRSTPAVEVGRTLRSRSPSPSKSDMSTHGRERVPSPAARKRSGTSVAKKRSPSPKSRKAVAHETCDDEFDFSVKTPTINVKSQSINELSIASQKEKAKKMLDESDDEDIGFLPTKRRRGLATSKVDKSKSVRSNNSKVGSEDDDWFGMPSDKKRVKPSVDMGAEDLFGMPSDKKRVKPPVDMDADDLFDFPTRKSRKITLSDNEQRVSPVRTRRSPSPSPTPKSRKHQVVDDPTEESISRKKSQTVSPRRREVITSEEEDNVVANVSSKKQTHGSEMPDGFLNSRHHTKTELKTKVKEEVDADAEDEELPKGLMMTAFSDLIVRKKKPTDPSVAGEDVPDGLSRWKGKLVKNFKRFKKTVNTGANYLPRIIGGRDLVVHAGTQRSDLDEWFKDALQAESQQNALEKEAQNLFDWEPQATGRTKRSR